MAKYLVMGLTGNSNDTAVWSDSDGGPTGATVPGATDDVICNSNSLTGASGNLTIAANFECKSWTSTGLTKILTVTASVYTFSIYGSWTLNGTYQKFAFTGTSYFYQKGTGTITTNGCNFLVLNRLIIDGAGITVTNGDDCNLGGTRIVITNGTWITNDKTITTTNSITTETGTKTITLGNSTIYVGGWVITTAGLTFNYNTSTVIMSGVGFYYSGLTSFYNVQIIGFDSITAAFSLATNLTILNDLTITGFNHTTKRILTKSFTIGTARTITVNGTTNITNCDFQDITLAGTANRDFSAQVDIGDCGGNSGITFPAAVTAYRVGVGNVSLATAWRTTSGGATQSRVPLPQDSAVIDANTGTGTLTMDCPRIGSIDMSAQNQAMTWALANAFSCYGHYILGTNVTPSGNFEITFLSTLGNTTMNFYDKTVFNLLFNRSTALYNFTSGVSLRKYAQLAGTVNLGSTTITVYLNASTATMFYVAGGSFNTETSTIILYPASGTADIPVDSIGNAITFNKLVVSGLHTGNFIFYKNNTFADLQIDAGRKVQVTAATTQTIAPTGRLTSVGTSASHGSLDSTTASPFNLVYAGTGYSQTHYLDVKSCNATANRFYTRGGTDGGGNTGFLFKSYAKSPQVINIP